MNRCQMCEQDWPNDLVHILFTNHGNVWLDPICAIKEIREIHNCPTLEFTGEMNKEGYLRALKIISTRTPPREPEGGG